MGDLRAAGVPCETFYDPGIKDDDPCLTLRHYARYQVRDPLTSVYLFCAARSELNYVVSSWLRFNPNGCVVLDRYMLSTYVYQPLKLASDLGMSLEDARRLVLGVCSALPILPVDVLIYLDVPSELAVSRMSKSSRSVDSGSDEYEKRGLQFASRLRASYHEIVGSGEMSGCPVDLGRLVVTVSQNNGQTPQEIYAGYRQRVFSALVPK